MKPKVIVVLGPTASGKTNLAVKLCQKFNGEIVSADSQQVYKDFDIGTAKEGKLCDSKNPLKVCRKTDDICQYLVDFVEPKQQFNLAEYQKLAYQKLDQIGESGKIPFLVGGTGLYIEAVTEGYVLTKKSTKKKVSRGELEKKTIDELLTQIKKLDPLTAKKIDRKNKRRIIRALEVTLLTGVPFSKQKTKQIPVYSFLKIGIKKEKEELLDRIKQRTKKMLEDGLIEETEKIVERFGKKLPALQSIGYKEVVSYLLGEYDKKELEARIIQNTKKYVKRQLTWFKRDKEIVWIKGYKEAERKIKKFLNEAKN